MASCSGTPSSSKVNIGKGAGLKRYLREFVEFVFGAAFDSCSVVSLCSGSLAPLFQKIGMREITGNLSGPSPGTAAKTVVTQFAARFHATEVFSFVMSTILL